VTTDLAHDRRAQLRRRLRRALRPAWLGTLRRTTPISECWGYDRGRPIDRYYIEKFIRAHRDDIHGNVLEIKEPLYCERYGKGVHRCDVLDKDRGNPRATIVADLAAADGIANDTYDCCIVTQTLQYIYDVQTAVCELYRILRPGGVVLVTMPAVTRLDARAAYPDYWRFTPDCCMHIFTRAFGTQTVTVAGHGNVLASVSFLEGLAQEELSAAELDINDPLFPLVITVRAVKRAPEV
jgi:SAM-dependent methyltransferase